MAASPFQIQARNRKILYIGLILVLFTAAWGWRRAVIDDLAEKLSIREEMRGDVELLGSVVRLTLIGSRGVVTCWLWNQAFEKQKLNQWNELEVLVKALTRLQPHFITPWLFQSWNLAYNVSVEADRPRDKYFYVTRGVELLAQGERQNRNHPDLRWNVGWYIQHKLGKSDETNYHRSLFQLSMIPPNERHPARFWKQDAGGPVFDYKEFARFAAEHPQLVRRLREGMDRESDRARDEQFTCRTPEDVVQFLEDNARVPSAYQLPDVAWPGQGRAWDPNAADRLMAELERFPVLPPVRQDKTLFDREALTSASWPLRDHEDPFSVAHSWYAYAQEPIPAPGALPGETLPIEDRARQRRPRNMTTTIFRNYPAQARRYTAERLQEEGWHDEEGWDLSDWFSGSPEMAGQTVRVGGGTKWSEEAWARAYRAWREYGEQNKLEFLSANDEENMTRAAQAYTKKFGTSVGGSPAGPRADLMTEEEKRQQHAAQWMFEYDFYRRVTNFPHFIARSRVEKEPVTVACRKMFHRAQRIKYAGKRNDRALKVYETKIDDGMIKADRTLAPLKGTSPILAWRDRVLKPNKDFRRDTFGQENSAEIQLAYMRLHNDVVGQQVKKQLVQAAPLVPLLPPLSHDLARPAIFAGPFENARDEDGLDFVPESAMETAVERMGLPSRRRRQAPPPPPGGGPPQSATPGKR